MEKKHENRFSIVFNPINEQQAFVINKLNSLPPRSLAVYLGQAVYAYEHRIETDSAHTDIQTSKAQQVSVPNTSGKRKRGRPPKKKPPEVESKELPPDSLSHIATSNQSEFPEAAYEKKSTLTDSNKSDGSSEQSQNVAAMMLESMQNFMGNC